MTMHDKDLVKRAASRLSSAAFLRARSTELEVMRDAAKEAGVSYIAIGFNRGSEYYDSQTSYWRQIDLETLNLMIKLATEADEIRAKRLERNAEADIERIKGQ